MEYITLEESENLFQIGIKTKDGIDTGDIIEIRLKDIELLDKLQKMRDDNKKNHQWINNQFVIIDKKQDFTKKGQLMSNNERLKYEAIKTFYKKEKDVYDMFLGEGAVDKLLHGRPLEWDTLKEIDRIIEKQIAPKLDINMKNIAKEIKDKYKIEKQESVLE